MFVYQSLSPAAVEEKLRLSPCYHHPLVRSTPEGVLPSPNALPLHRLPPLMTVHHQQESGRQQHQDPKTHHHQGAKKSEVSMGIQRARRHGGSVTLA